MNAIKLKGFIMYNIGGGYCWVRIGNLKIEWMAQSSCNGFCGEYECKENQGNCKRKVQER